MIHYVQRLSLLGLLILGLGLPALAIMSDTEGPRTTLDDLDYTAGLAAFKRADWQGVVDSMSRVVVRRPWHDDAHNILGFAYRQLGNYQRALAHYQQALTLNPYHRGALEYLGETYLALGCVTQARDLLTRLATACKRLKNTGSPDDWQAGCAEWQELQAALTTYSGPTREDCLKE